MKPGYKQTEVGVIPEEWDVKRLADCATIATGNTPPTSDATNYGDEYLFVSPVDLGESKYVANTEKRLSKKGFSISRHFPKDSILFVCIGSTIGKCGVAPVELTSNQQINAIFPSSSFLTDYLYYSVCRAAPKVRALAGEHAVPIVNKTQFGETVVAFPRLPEQRAIAEALGDVDALLAALDRLIAKKRDVKKAAMQQLLNGQTRLPGFDGQWRTGMLGSFVISHNSGVYKKSELYGHGCNIVGVSDLYGIDSVDGQEFAQVPLSVAERVRYTLGCNDLLYGESSLVREGIARTIYVTKRGGGTAFAWHTRRYSVDQSVIISSFLNYYLQGERARKHMMDNCIQTAITGINTAAYFACPVLIPPLSEQAAIAEVLSDMDAELTALEKRREKTRVLRQGMTQELLTGKTRLVSQGSCHA